LDKKPKPSEETVKHLATALNVEDFVATLLVQRGINTFEEAKAFFRPSLDNLHDPYLMKDMKNASRSNRKRRKYSCFGDYDVDGTTAVSLVSSYLKPITLMLLPIFRIGMTKVTAFHLKELTLQMTMVFAYYRFRLWYKIDRSCGIRQSKKY
jgi:hypothetical protein